MVATRPRSTSDVHTLGLVEEPALREGGKPQRVLTGARKIPRLRGRQRAFGPARRIRRQIHRALKKPGRGGLPTARTRSDSRALKLIRYHLVGTRPRPGRDATPGDRDPPRRPSPRRSPHAPGAARPGTPHRYAAARTSGCRNRTRTPNSHSPASSAGAAASCTNALQLGRPPHEDRLSERIGGRNEQQPLGLGRQRPNPAPETLLEPVGQR